MFYYTDFTLNTITNEMEYQPVEISSKLLFYKWWHNEWSIGYIWNYCFISLKKCYAKCIELNNFINND